MNPPYTHEEVVDNFRALLAGRDFGAEFRQLGIGALQFMRRKQMRLEFRGLFIGLWRLALTRSFPDDGEQIFERYLELCLNEGKKDAAARIVERARQYADMLALRGDTDFSEVSRHLTSFLQLPDAARKSVNLKVALEIRKTYNFIFQRMI